MSNKDDMAHGTSDRIDLVEIWNIVWAKKWTIVAVAVLSAAMAATYVMVSDKWYRSIVLLAPTEDQSVSGLQGQLGSLGGLAGLAGVSIGGKSTDEQVAILESRDFARAFIEDKNLLTTLLADRWNAETEEWHASEIEDQPDVRDGVKFFLEEVLNVSVNKKTELVTLQIEWIDADLAASWAMELVLRLNEYLRQRALMDAENNVTFLRGELERTNMAPLRQSISNVLETELQKLMLAKGADEYAFRVLDSAQVAKNPIRPQSFLLIVGTLVLGGMIAVFTLLVRDGISRQIRIRE